MTGFGPAVLLMVQGCPPGSEQEVSRWHAEEHIAERLAIPGFRRGRRSISPEAPADARFLMMYEADEPEVFASAAYQARLNDPTPWSRQVIGRHFAGLRRTVCLVRQGRGNGVGGWYGVILLSEAPGDLSHEIDAAVARPGVIGAHALEGTDIGQQPTAEQRARGGDTRFAGAVLMEATDEAPLREVTREIAGRLPAEMSGVYHLQHLLTSD